MVPIWLTNREPAVIICYWNRYLSSNMRNGSQKLNKRGARCSFLLTKLPRTLWNGSQKYPKGNQMLFFVKQNRISLEHCFKTNKQKTRRADPVLLLVNQLGTFPECYDMVPKKITKVEPNANVKVMFCDCSECIFVCVRFGSSLGIFWSTLFPKCSGKYKTQHSYTYSYVTAEKEDWAKVAFRH